MFDLLEVGSSRFSLSMNWRLPLFNATCPGLDGLRFFLLKALPMEAKLCLLDIYNDILATRVVPQSWNPTKVVPGKDPLLSGSYRPINLLACGRKLRKEWHIVSYSVWF
jgi:hypothetical protein